VTVAVARYAPPPYSNERTSVWHWTLDGVQTTVMLNKTTWEVWCNGRTLPTNVRRVHCKAAGAYSMRRLRQPWT